MYALKLYVKHVTLGNGLLHRTVSEFSVASTTFFGTLISSIELLHLKNARLGMSSE